MQQEVTMDGPRKTLAKRLENLDRLINELGQPVSQLWVDAYQFLIEAIKRPGKRTPRRERLIRAAVLTDAAALEGCTNFLAERVAKAGAAGGKQLMESQIDCLREKRKVLDNGTIIEKSNCTVRGTGSCFYIPL